MVVRLDGRAYTKFCEIHNFEKPNDDRSLELMNRSAKGVMEDMDDIILAYGQSDEYSFLFKKDSTFYQRRTEKILSVVVSLFTSHFVLNFEPIFGERPKKMPCFDGRVVSYPNEKAMVDYFNWRQCDAHINNLYNTIFWTLGNEFLFFKIKLVRKGGRTNQQAEIE
jgi:tRNA(His) guanylyltransferase